MSHQDNSLSVHLPQQAYAQNIFETHGLVNINFNAIATPYRSGCFIDATLSATLVKDDKACVSCHEAYQSLAGRLT
jgi:hypothetical protein